MDKNCPENHTQCSKSRLVLTLRNIARPILKYLGLAQLSINVTTSAPASTAGSVMWSLLLRLIPVIGSSGNTHYLPTAHRHFISSKKKDSMLWIHHITHSALHQHFISSKKNAKYACSICVGGVDQNLQNASNEDANLMI